MNQEKIGSFISKKRKEKKLTQEALAEKLNVSKNAVSKWERGICLMDMSLLKPLSEILDVSINEILNGEEIKKEELKEKTDEVLNNTINYSTKKIKKIKNKILFIVLVSIIILFLGTFLIDYKRIKENLNPLFMIPISENGSEYTYLGPGYKMVKKTSVSPLEPLVNSREIRFGLWFFTWQVKIFNTKPYNIWITNGDNSILMNVGSYCITDTIEDDKSSECGLSIPIEKIKYKEVLEAFKNQTIELDSKFVKISQVRFYDLNGNKINIAISNKKYSFKVPDLLGEYLVLLDTISERGSVWYSFKISIN